MSIHVFSLSKHTTARRYLAKRDINWLKKNIISIYNFYRSCCYQQESSPVQRGQRFVLMLNDRLGNEHVVGTIKVKDVSKPACELTKKDLDRIIDCIIARGNRETIDSLVRKECSLRMRCTLIPDFSNGEFEIELLKPASEKILPVDQAKKPEPHKMDDEDLISSGLDFVLNLDGQPGEQEVNATILEEKYGTTVIPNCVLEPEHSLPLKFIEQLKSIDQALDFKLVPLDEYVNKIHDGLREKCTFAAFDALDPDDDTIKNNYELILGSLHDGIRIGTFEITDLTESSSGLTSSQIQEITEMLTGAEQINKAQIEKVVAHVAKDNLATRMLCRVRFNNLAPIPYSGQTMNVPFSVLSANQDAAIPPKVSADLRRVRNVELSPENDPELRRMFLELEKGLSFTIVRKKS